MRTVLAVVTGLTLVGACGEPPSPPQPHQAPASPASAPHKPDAAPPSPVPEIPAAFVPQTPADYVGKHVLVPHGAQLRVAPQDDAPAVTLHLEPGQADGVPPVRTMEVVGHDGPFIAVRPTLEGRGCTDAMPGLAAFDIKLWIRPAALAPALGVRTTITRAEGDAAVLWPGVPVLAPVLPTRTETTVDVGGLALVVPIPATQISTAFAPEPLPSVPATASSLGDGPPVTWGGIALDEDALLDAPGVTQPAAVFQARAASGRQAATVWARCAELTVALDRSRPTHPPKADKVYSVHAGSAPLSSANLTTYEVGEGSDVWWPDGTKAGAVSASHTFMGKPRQRKGRSCFDLALSERGMIMKVPSPDSLLELCFDAADVREQAPAGSLLIGGTALEALIGSSSSSGAFVPLGAGTMDSALDDALLGGLIGEEIGGDIGGLGTSDAGAGGSVGTISLGTLGTAEGSTPRVKLGAVSTTGDLDRDVGRRILRMHVDELRQCYETVLADKEGASGKVRLTLAVDTFGNVTSAKVSDDTVAGGIAECIQAAATAWTFPEPGGDSTVVTTVLFTAM